MCVCVEVLPLIKPRASGGLPQHSGLMGWLNGSEIQGNTFPESGRERRVTFLKNVRFKFKRDIYSTTNLGMFSFQFEVSEKAGEM